VIRDGKQQQIAAVDLVVGDIVNIKNGNKVPADARVLYCSELKLETSSITGEAEAIEFTAAIADANVTVFESRNVAFNGSFCVDGEAIGIVIRTGTKTVHKIEPISTNVNRFL
jgi:sodium/potassium-transporting ATPase subunit alpha